MPHITSLMHNGQLSALVLSRCPAFSASQCRNGYICDDFAGNAFVLARRPGSPGHPTGGLLAGPLGTFEVTPQPEYGFWTIRDLRRVAADVPSYRVQLTLKAETDQTCPSAINLPQGVQLQGSHLISHQEMNIFAPSREELQALLPRITQGSLGFSVRLNMDRAARWMKERGCSVGDLKLSWTLETAAQQKPLKMAQAAN